MSETPHESAHEPPRGPHDLGGLPAGLVEPENVDMLAWEKQANGMRLVLVGGAVPRLTLDELRRAAEDLGEDYAHMAYFERTTSAARTVLIERGYFTADELAAQIAEIERREAETPFVPPTQPTRHAVSHQEDEAPGPYAVMSQAMQEILVDKGLLNPDDVRSMIERIDQRSEGGLGAKVVARAWTDPAYKKRLLEDGGAACEELGIPVGDLELVVVENTPDAHNVVVCTLCSCYPRPLLGMPPHWYKSRNYRSRCVIEPRQVLREFGTDIPEDVTIRVHDSNADMRYLVLPMRPEGAEGLNEKQLAGLVTRDCMIGVSQPRRPQ